MATTDNKVLDGAGVAQLSQLVKNAIAQGGGGGAVSGMTGMELLQFLAGGAGMTIFEQELVADLPHPASDTDIVAQLKARGWCVTGPGASAKASDILAALEDNTTMVYYAGVVQSYGVQWYASNASSRIIVSGSYVFYQPTASPAHLYIIPSDLFAQAFGNYIGFKSLSGLTSTTLAKGIDEVNNKIPSIATTETPGTVIPDGTTITIDSNGVISSQGGGGSSYTFTNGLTESDGTVSWDGYYTTPDNRGAAVNLGYDNTVYNYSKGVAIGVNCQAGMPYSGFQATAIGNGCKATGECSFAGGEGAQAQGKGAFSYGIENYAYDNYSVSLGQGTSARTVGCVALGAYNIENASFRVWGKNQYYWGDGEIVRYGDYLYKSISSTTPATTANAPTGEATSNTWWEYVSPVPPIYKLIFGNGTATNARSNLMAVDDYGNGCFSGDLYVKASNYSLRGAGGQKVFYGTLTSTETAPTVEGAINWVYK